MPVKLVIFDLDGTLIDSLQDITGALNHALQRQGLKPLAEKEVAGMVGEGVTRLIEKALGPEKTHLKESVLTDYSAFYDKHMLDHTVPYPGVREMLENLRGYKKAVITNKRYASSEKTLKGLGLFEYFDMIAGPEAVPERKPSPEPVKYVLRELGLESRQAVMVGDSRFDIEAGKGASVRCVVAVGWGYSKREDLKGADYIIDNMEQLVPILYGSEPMLERRKNDRHPMDTDGQEIIKLVVKKEGRLLPAQFIDLSRQGIRFDSAVPFAAGEKITCVVSAPKSFENEMELAASVLHSRKHKRGGYLIGGRITRVSDELWFRIIKTVHEFMKDRKGGVR